MNKKVIIYNRKIPISNKYMATMERPNTDKQYQKFVWQINW